MWKAKRKNAKREKTDHLTGQIKDNNYTDKFGQLIKIKMLSLEICDN